MFYFILIFFTLLFFFFSLLNIHLFSVLFMYLIGLQKSYQYF